MKAKIIAGFKRVCVWLQRHILFQYLLMAICTTLVVEILNQRSIVGGLAFPLQNPLLFLLNTGIVLFMLSVSLLFKRRYFVCVLVLIIPLGLAIANFILVGMRIIPLEFVDFSILRTGIGIIGIYMTPWQLAALALVVVLAIVGLVVLWRRLPKSIIDIKHRVTMLLFCVLMPLGVALTVDLVQAVPASMGNIAEAYEEYGFIYCFSMSIFDKGVEKPDGYSAAAVQAVTDETQRLAEADGESDRRPNVLFLQLESFFDINAVQDIELSENPVPNFTKLKEEYTSGFLTVPSVGAGTANTEFEVISQMSLDYFGTGEYPFETVLLDTSCESVATDLRSLGYGAHAIHNHTGAFYCRNRVYSSLGFDTFTPLEYMTDVETNPQGFARDAILVRYILGALDKTTGPDYVYTVSVQGHGKYPTSPVGGEQPITVAGLDDEATCEYEYYVNQIHEMDQFIGDLIEALSARDEETVLVLYGDHLPSLGIQEESLSRGNLYQTEYVIWDNMHLPQHDKDLSSYQLSSYVLAQIGLHTGTMTRAHQFLQDSDDYQPTLHLLEYDLLYGKRYGQTVPQPENDFVFGLWPVKVTGVTAQEDGQLLTGENFTRWSHVHVNGHAVETSFEDGCLRVPADSISPGDVVTVVQICDDRTVLGTSEAYIQK